MKILTETETNKLKDIKKHVDEFASHISKRMESISSILTPEVYKKLRDVQIKTEAVQDDILYILQE